MRRLGIPIILDVVSLGFMRRMIGRSGKLEPLVQSQRTEIMMNGRLSIKSLVIENLCFVHPYNADHAVQDNEPAAAKS